MSNIFPLDRIPPESEEIPVRNYNGFVLANPAYHCRHDHLFPPRAGEPPVPEGWRMACDLYLANFCKPIRNIANQVSCVACNQLMVAPQGKQLANAISWDPNTEFGEGRCEGCGYPIRTGHKIWELPRHGRQLLVSLPFFPLCYHPRALEKRS